MKKRILHALAFAGALFCWGVAAAHAQTQTNVTGTVVDPLGIPYANGTYSVQLIPAGTNPTVNGNSIGGAFNGRLDANGSFNISLWPNASIVPGGTQWQFTICIPGGIQPPLGTGGQCTPPTNVTIAGASQSLSATLSAVAPRLTTITIGGGSVTSFSAGNLSPLFNSSVATATTTPALTFAQIAQLANLVYAGPVSGGAANPTFRALVPADLPVAPSALDCSTFPGADMGAKLNACFAAAPAAGAVFDATKFTSPQTISTAVNANKPGVITTCGLAISQTASITLNANTISWLGCPDQATIITKGANLDQFIVTGTANNVIQYVDLEGNKGGGFTGNGITSNGVTSLILKNLTINGEGTDGISDTGTFVLTIDDVNITDFAVSALVMVGDQIQANNLQAFTNLSDETGPVVTCTVGGSLTSYYSGYFGGTVSAFATVIINTCSMRFEQSSAISSNGYPGMDIISGSGLIEGLSGIGSGGANGAALKMFNSTVNVTNSTISSNGTSADAIFVDASNVQIVNNFIALGANGTGSAAIHIVNSATAALITDNDIAWNSAAVPTGLNYGIWLATNGVNAFNFNKIMRNSIQAAGKANSVGIFWDNSANQAAAANQNQFEQNGCVNVVVSCIKRTDTQGTHNFYSDNITDGVSALFGAGGSTTDVVVHHDSIGVAFATLPNAGIGSQVFCTDCQRGSPAAAGGLGGFVYRISSDVSGTPTVQWSGAETVIGQDTHTAEITGNYAAVTLIPSTAPTGSYFVMVYTEVSTGVATSTIIVNLAYADDTGAQTDNGVLFSGATAGTKQSLVFPVRFVTGTALTYATTTANSPKYKIIARAEAQ